MIEGSCHCGAVQVRVASAPTQITSCNCSICRRTGALMAYYKLSEVEINGETDVYMWGDRCMEFHRCKACGCHTHWWPVDTSSDRLGVNMRMMDPTVMEGVRVRRFDGGDTWKFLD